MKADQSLPLPRFAPNDPPPPLLAKWWHTATATASVGIGPIATGFGLNARMVVNLPGVDRAVAQKLVDTAHQVCPYSNATRGNIDVVIELA